MLPEHCRLPEVSPALETPCAAQQCCWAAQSAVCLHFTWALAVPPASLTVQKGGFCSAVTLLRLSVDRFNPKGPCYQSLGLEMSVVVADEFIR